MMPVVANIIRWEWFKLRRRWILWILLAILLLFSQLIVWGNFFNYREIQGSFSGQVRFPVNVGESGEMVIVQCDRVLAGDDSAFPPGIAPGQRSSITTQCQDWESQRLGGLQQALNGFTLPGSIPVALSIVSSMGVVLGIVLATSLFGTEYGWGTLRPVLARGVERKQYVAGKFGMLALASAGAILVVAVVTAISSLLAATLAPGDVAIIGNASWSDAIASTGRTLLALLPYLALAGLVTILTTSSAVGMAIALGYYFAEMIAVGILLSLFEWFQTVADYLLGRNVTAWVSAGDSGASGGFAFALGEYPGELHAFIVVVAYTLILGGLAFWIFKRRDVAGSTGS